ncbi:MAG: UbiA family prenyltransferase [Thermoplasmata archaeon]|nr:UbiA family prenyltransferase [Thermoplasmata archaeon]
MNPYLQILRIGNCVMASLAVILVGIILRGTGLLSYSFPLLYAVLVVFFITAGGNVLNDYFDREVDLINHPERPIPSGKIKPKSALIYGSVLLAIGIIFSFFINILAVIIAIVAVFLILSYEYSLKKMGFIGNIVISTLVGMLFVFGGAVFGNIYFTLIFAFMAFSSNLGREIVKDIEDMEGDVDRITLPMKIGKKLAGLSASIFFIIAVVLSPLPYLLGFFGISYLIAVLISDIVFIYAAIIHFKDPHKGQKTAKIAMLIGLISYLIGGLV